MRICVVGGTGNISTSFVRLLLELGHDVTCFNRGQSGTPPEGARVIVGDRQDRQAFEQRMQQEAFDAAIDMICFNREDALSSLRAFQGVGHFVHCSTVCTYGIDYDWYPSTEDHPLRPITDYGRNKAAADSAFLEAYYRSGFPVTIIKPSSTFGPRMGLLRQVSWEFAWIDRIRKGKPIVVCGDGQALHNLMHVDDAALCFAHVVGKDHCIGQTYNMVTRGYTTWAKWHRAVMRVIGREVELVGVPFADLMALDVPNFGGCRDIFAHSTYYSAEKLYRDVPEYRPTLTLEDGIADVLEAMDREGRVPSCDGVVWEDHIIEAQRGVRSITLE